VEIFFKIHFNLAAQWRATYLCFLFYFLGISVLFNFSIFKMDGCFVECLGFAAKGKGAQHSCFSGWGGWWNEEAMEWRDRERMQVATARNGMHRNGRSYRKPIWLPFTGCLGYALWGKGKTEWNEQNNFGACSGLSRCIVGLALFCIFFTQNNKRGYASANTRKAIAWLLRNGMREYACLGSWGGWWNGASAEWQKRPQGTQEYRRPSFSEWWLWLGYLT